MLEIWMTSTLTAVIPIVWSERYSRLLWSVIHSSIYLFVVSPVRIHDLYVVRGHVISKRVRPLSCSQTLRLKHKNNADRVYWLLFAIMAMILTINIKDYVKSGTFLSIRKATKAFAIIRYTASQIPCSINILNASPALKYEIVFSKDGLADLQYRDENYCFSKSDQGLSDNSRLSLSSDVRGPVHIEDDLSLNSKEVLLLSSVWNNSQHMYLYGC